MTDLDGVKLAPCPFCGCNVTLKEGAEGRIFSFICPPGSSCIGAGLGTYALEKSRAEAIAAWNRRALSPTPEAPGTGGAGARAQVFTYEHSPMGDGRYVTTISNDPPPPTLWCRVKRFTPATPAETQAVEVGDRLVSEHRSGANERAAK